MAYSHPPGATLKLSPFRAEASQKDLDFMLQLVKLSPLGPQTYENSFDDPFKYGIGWNWMSKAKQVWETSYDWRKCEARINSFPNYTAEIEDGGETFTVQFLALFSERRDAVPVTYLHGWPGSILEFLDVLDEYKSRYSAKDLPYHIVVPSLPGYGYSSGPPKGKDFDVETMAGIINKLMVGLGFKDGYIAQGGDVGSFTSRYLSANHAECKAIHLNFCPTSRPEGLPEGVENADELKQLSRLQEFVTVGRAYSQEHGTRPATIGFALSSSPLAQLAWIGEKFLVWTHDDPPVEQVLDSVSLYWLTQTFARCLYPYRGPQVRTSLDIMSPSSKYHLKKPFGYSWFPYELMPIPKAWAEKTGNLVWHRQHTEGGHFAAMERPKIFVDDMEDFVKQVWPAASKL